MTSNYVNFLEQTMDYSALKRKTNADNISNINTPNFKATKVAFDNLFEKEMQVKPITSREKHINNGNDSGVSLYKDTSTKERYDGNNVDLNQEMVEMIKNNYSFSLSVQAINKEFVLNKSALGKG